MTGVLHACPLQAILSINPDVFFLLSGTGQACLSSCCFISPETCVEGQVPSSAVDTPLRVHAGEWCSVVAAGAPLIWVA